MEHTITAGQIYKCTSNNYAYTGSLFRILEATPDEITAELIIASEKAISNNRLVGCTSKLTAFRFKNIMTLAADEPPEHYETDLQPATFNDLFGG